MKMPPYEPKVVHEDHLRKLEELLIGLSCLVLRWCHRGLGPEISFETAEYATMLFIQMD